MVDGNMDGVGFPILVDNIIRDRGVLFMWISTGWCIVDNKDKYYYYSASLWWALGFWIAKFLLCCHHALGAGQGHAINAGGYHAVDADDRKVVLTCGEENNSEG